MDSPRWQNNLTGWFRGLLLSNVYALVWILFLTANLHAPASQALHLISFAIVLSGTLEIPTGWFADRWGRKLSLVLGSVACVLGVLMIATSAGLNIWLILGVAIEYTGAALCGGADSALGADTCAEIYKAESGESLSYI